MFERSLAEKLKRKIQGGKALVLIGARQVGKTTLLNHILEGKDFLFLDGDDPTTRSLLNSPNTEQLRSLIGDSRIVFLDEAQRIKGIGLTLKIITDQFKQVSLLVSGSSAFDLGSELNEPLTGRKWEYELYPISWEEYEAGIGYLKSEQQLENRLLYGFYPEVIVNQGEERETLKNIVDSYLYKDILSFADIRKPEVLEKLLQALALQTGSEVNYNELAQLIGINKITVQTYIDILEKGYVVFRLNSFSRNLRNEIKQNRKVYFYDNGVRNMILGNFQPLNLRQDKGALWENFLISERLKQNKYKNTFAQMYFWRTTQQQEIDFVEVKDGAISGYEFKWKAQKAKFSKTFTETYKAETQLVNRDNFRKFVLI
ncbi:MAG: ATP-binding protein [Candidatus Cyclonatronum sp.]|uniref:ATP-binding protein n=1 Tax=Cyclonatronum sp. TaxID=3024185 RepID=UPI0025C197AB|nr:ATP-binding protein [Cyclonatronum sp.]MCH8485489.1 ATP-binding protein [Cyclonatronum sp.]